MKSEKLLNYVDVNTKEKVNRYIKFNKVNRFFDNKKYITCDVTELLGEKGFC